SLAKGRLIVKDSFKGESGIVRFFAADELNRRRVNGAAPVSLKGIVFDSTFVARAANDSLYFYAHVRSRAALQQLWCYVLNDSLPLAPLENNWFKSERGIFIVWSGFQFSYYFKATDAEGRTVTSRLYKHYINLDVDVEVAEGAIRYIGGEWVMLEATVQNKSGNTVTGLEVLYRTKTPSDSLWQTVGKDTISIDAYATSVSRIRHTPSPGELWVEVVLDPDSLVREDTKENNRTAALLTPRYFQATPEGFLLAEGRRSELQVGRLSIEMPAGALKRPSALAVWPLEKVSINQQPDYSHRRGTPAFHVELMTNEMLQRPAYLRLDTADSTIADSVRTEWKLYRFAKQTKKWVRCDTRVEGNVLTAEERILGPLAVLEVRDDKPPQISVAVDGQPYVDYKWAGDEPRLGIRLQDENGIDLSPGRLMIALDDLPVDSTEIALPDSIIDGNQIVISYNPKLTPGEHILTVQATDCNRNLSDIQEYYLRIAEELQIQMLGNYPNPFRQETRFAYILTTPVDDLSLKIYTASGKLIRSFKPADIIDDPNPLSADYHEILWDGKDAEGFETANGVYFYRLTAKSGGKTRTISGKIAKIL
ncbi:MAG: hypothetical protein ONB24_08380, partial [candidate division KSB1 bacterium]|nr:hypothetical protein [candidate division KSB1 bacterium]